ncbi:MAG TPA: HAMP domain-containing protein, partial [Thermodesulfobacteriota bacterium]|nr:HAMP domain-containing protein [Thermodesulfobacteriota bacterium]
LARTLEAAVARSAPIVSLRLLDGEGRTVVRWEDGTAAGDDLEELTLPVAPAGEVRVGLSRAAIGAEGGLARGRVVLAALALAATALAVALLVSRRITRPLVMLNMEALLVAKGELDGELPVRGRNEIAQLAASFNRMIRALREMRARDRASNPLTGLPGNERVLAELSARLARGEPFAACYVDIDHFKAYNDQYGFVRGDEVLLALGRMLEGVAAEEGGEGCFVGHIGGDDFLVVCAPERAEPLARAAVARFDAAVPGWYAEADRERGCLVTVDRQGREARVPLMSLSVAIVTNRHRPLAHPGEVAQIAAQLKQKAKATPGSTVVVDQRRSWEGRLPDRRPAAGGGGLSGPTAHA